MTHSPQESGRFYDREAQRHPIKLLVGYEVAGREEQWAVESFSGLSEAIVTAKEMVDSFLLRHHRPHQRGCQLYEYYVKFGPDLVVEASMEAPVFEGWSYARKRVRQLCGVW